MGICRICEMREANYCSANIQNIVDQFKASDVGSAFTCADNSETVVENY